MKTCVFASNNHIRGYIILLRMYPKSIYLHIDHWQTMLEHVRDCMPQEACGLLGGEAEKVYWVQPVKNVACGPFCFRMDKRQQVDSLMRMEEKGYKLIGIYHSHPLGSNIPSKVDIKEAAYPEAAYLVWSHSGEQWQCRAFAMLPDGPQEIPITLYE